MNRTSKVLLVDDEESIHMVIEQALKKEAYQILYAENGEKALEYFHKESPDLVILDIMLPIIDGYEVCRLIREKSNVPILMLSAKGDIVDKSIGFNFGADDYVVKPFSPVELSLRVKALLRRSGDHEQDTKLPCSQSIIKGELEINCERHEVFIRGKMIYLTPKEFELLCFMAEHPARVFTREQLFSQMWGEEYISDPSTITVFIRKLREKIERNPAKPEYIRTVWGVGYKFSD
ncbi:response regulator transcription factor [Desulfitobacterium sp.]|uniref:response regulator transcription factor n=1 Tax=Desulfitobacterium sp. TaxID=49981 RepID=UPI002B1EB1BD|nr:response regulator transcription factor [Desulfitobacterium sp.]MEA4902465.1 response regulator transcription factor [Desulfitobacterium sp.]